MNENLKIIMQCAAKFPNLRFGQFLTNVLNGEELYSIEDEDFVELCKVYCKNMGV